MSSISINKEAADDIATVLSHNTKLQVLYLANSDLETSGVIKIAKGLHNASSLIVINISNNSINEEAADDIAAVLSHNSRLEILELGNKYLGILCVNYIVTSIDARSVTNKEIVDDAI